MVWAFVINFVAVLSERYTVLTFLIRLMFSFALRFNLFQVGFETLMLDKFVGVRQTVNAFLPRSMITWLLNLFYVIFGNTKAVDALRVRTVIAVGLFDFLICFWLIGLLFLK